jgi:hypothetical protein
MSIKELTDEQISQVMKIFLLQNDKKTKITSDEIARYFKINTGRIAEVKNAVKKKFLNKVINQKKLSPPHTQRALTIEPATEDDAFKLIEKINNQSASNPLLKSARDAMIMAVSIFNDPSYFIKSEGFPIFAIIAWTRLLQAYSSTINYDYRKESDSDQHQGLDYSISVFNFLIRYDNRIVRE